MVFAAVGRHLRLACWRREEEEMRKLEKRKGRLGEADDKGDGYLNKVIRASRTSPSHVTCNFCLSFSEQGPWYPCQPIGFTHQPMFGNNAPTGFLCFVWTEPKAQDNQTLQILCSRTFVPGKQGSISEGPTDYKYINKNIKYSIFLRILL